MIKHHRGKTTGHVTDTAIGGRRHMIDRLSERRHTIMTGTAVTGDAGVIEYRAGKTGRAMTNTAILAGGDMRRRLRKGTNCTVHTIVAGDTVSGDTRMGEYRRIE